MDETEPLSDEVLAELMNLHVWNGQDYGDLERDLAIAYARMRQLIAEVRRLRAERVRWEALRLAAVAVANEERWCPYADVEDGERYYAPSSDDVDTLQAVVAALTT